MLLIRSRAGGRGPALLVLLASLWACAPDPLASPAVAAGGDGYTTPEAVAAPAPAGPELAALDRCADLWARPDRRFDPRTCEPKESPAEIAANGGVVLFGSFWDVTERRSSVPSDLRCKGSFTHATNASFAASIRSQRPAGAPPLAFVHLHRFELVPSSFAALPGFDAGFLLRTRKPWAEVQGFFADDRSPPCRGRRCAWSDSFVGDPERDVGERLRDWIDASAGPGAYRSMVYYMGFAGAGRSLYWPTAALADLRNERYRAWRVAEARRALSAGGYDAIMLNQKFGQYRLPGGHWLGGAARDVQGLNQTETTLWTAPPEGYGYPEYVAGWAALGRDLRAAGVPYAVWLSSAVWYSRWYDDPTTPDVDEAALIRETARGARLALVGGPLGAAQIRSLEQELRGGGARLVLADAARAGCPEEPQRPLTSGTELPDSAFPGTR